MPVWLIVLCAVAGWLVAAVLLALFLGRMFGPRHIAQQLFVAEFAEIVREYEAQS